LTGTRFRRAIEAHPVAVDSIPIAITASFGVAARPPARPLDPQEMPRLAADALYRAKEHGRNRSELATPQDLTTTSPVPAGRRRTEDRAALQNFRHRPKKSRAVEFGSVGADG
jgi:hypothetical protein